MAIEFNLRPPNDGLVTYSPSTVADIDPISISIWLYVDTTDATYRRTIVGQYYDEDNYSWALSEFNSTITLDVLHTGTTPAYKRSQSTTKTIQQWIHIYAVPKWGTDPSLIYINGVETTYLSQQTTNTTRQTETGGLLMGGGYEPAQLQLKGSVQDVKIFNRILSANEIYSLYASRKIYYMQSGLVFHAPLIGASGLTKFDGANLGTTNYLKDIIGNTNGVPSGIVGGAGNTFQKVR